MFPMKFAIERSSLLQNGRSTRQIKSRTRLISSHCTFTILYHVRPYFELANIPAHSSDLAQSSTVPLLRLCASFLQRSEIKIIVCNICRLWIHWVDNMSPCVGGTLAHRQKTTSSARQVRSAALSLYYSL